MKRNAFLLMAMFICCNFVGAHESIPAPIFYKLSKRILSETQQFVENGEGKTSKIKSAKFQISPSPLKCQSKKEQKIKTFGILSISNRESLWKIKPEN